jgi:hypothetical protein
VLIGSPDLKANHRITQIFDFPGEHEKYPKLVRILEKVGWGWGARLREWGRGWRGGRHVHASWPASCLVASLPAAAPQEMDGRRILIFCETKKGCDAVTRQLRMDGWPALSIHGDKSQHERDWVLAEFKAGKHPIMIATDVAARGLGRSGAAWPPPGARLQARLPCIRCSLVPAPRRQPAVHAAAAVRLPWASVLPGRLLARHAVVGRSGHAAALPCGSSCCRRGPAAGGVAGEREALLLSVWEHLERPPAAALLRPGCLRPAAAPLRWCAGHLRACTATHPPPPSTSFSSGRQNAARVGTRRHPALAACLSSRCMPCLLDRKASQPWVAVPKLTAAQLPRCRCGKDRRLWMQGGAARAPWAQRLHPAAAAALAPRPPTCQPPASADRRPA